jgi:hypothetical protein
MNAKVPHAVAASSPSPAKRPATERDDLRKRLVRLIADREAAKHVARKEIRGK